MFLALWNLVAGYGNGGSGGSGGPGGTGGGGYSAGYWVVVAIIAAVVIAAIVGAVLWYRSRRRHSTAPATAESDRTDRAA